MYYIKRVTETRDQIKMKTKNAKKPAKSQLKCDRTAAMNGCSAHAQLRLTSFFDWIDDPQYAPRAVSGLKTWKMTNAHRLTVADKVNIDYVLRCYQQTVKQLHRN
jgi:hypothetical protein